MKMQLDDRHVKGEDWSMEKKNLHSEIDKWKNRCEELEERQKNEIVSVRDRV